MAAMLVECTRGGANIYRYWVTPQRQLVGKRGLPPSIRAAAAAVTTATKAKNTSARCKPPENGMHRHKSTTGVYSLYFTGTLLRLAQNVNVCSHYSHWSPA